jgi:putative transcriptional regulator
MNFLDKNKQEGIKQLKAGQLLIAEPFLSDPNFARSVILLCEYGEEGSVGFVLNRPTELTLGDLLPELYAPAPSVSQGGPVQLDTLHMLHRIPEILGGKEIAKGIYWGGSYEALQDMISQNIYQPGEMKLFLGYSGWSPGQLEKEMEEGSWLVADINPEILFDTEPEMVWKKAIELLGKDYAILANMPLNPQLN